MDPRTTIPELFAIVRQWVPQVQHKIDVIGNEVSLLSYYLQYYTLSYHLKQVNTLRFVSVSSVLNFCFYGQLKVSVQLP